MGAKSGELMYDQGSIILVTGLLAFIVIDLDRPKRGVMKLKQTCMLELKNELT